MTKNNLFLTAIFFLFILVGHSQNYSDFPKHEAFLDGNDMLVYFHSGGDMSWDFFGKARYTVPASSGSSTIFASNLWLGGFDQSGSLHAAATTYRQSGVDFWPGPKADNYDSTYYDRYGYVWKIRADEVADHQALFNQPGYQVPQDILTWPGNGDTTNGEPWHLAPFVDVNLNGIYEPMQGDFPAIQGDQALYMVYSDAQFYNYEAMSDQLEVDIHTMAYVYKGQPGTPVDQTLFVSHRIVNRSSNTYQFMRVGQWVDFDIGYCFDDLIGCDTTREAFFGYKADSMGNLSASTSLGYGTTPPAQAVTFLNTELAGFTQYKPGYSYTGFPENKNDYYGYLRNVWKNGNPFTIGGNGNVGTVSTNYHFPGDPRDSSQWSMYNSGVTPRDVKGVGSIAPFTFHPGESICLDMAYVYAKADSGNNLSSVGKLYDNLDVVRAFADSTVRACPLLQTQVVTTGVSVPDAYQPQLELFPNPVSGVLNVESEEGPCQVTIKDIQGRTMYVSSAESEIHTIDTTELPEGMYIVLIDLNGIRYTSQVLVN